MKFAVVLLAVCAAVPVSAQHKPVISIGEMQAEAAAAAEARTEARAEVVQAEVAMQMMPANTIVSLTPRAEISSKRVEEGQKVAFVGVEDVVENGVVVIPRGSVVQANIPWKTGRAIGGKSGKFEVAFESVNVHGRAYAMSGQYRQEGRGNSVGALLGSMIVTGRSAVMLPGQIVTAFTNEPIPYRMPG